MGTVLGTAINPSPTIVLPAKVALTGARYLALAVDAGKVKIPSAGANVIGIAIGETDDAVAAGADVDIQIKDIGKWKAGAAIAVGAELATDANGKAVTATAGQFIVGIAITAASAAGDLVQVQITKSGYKAASSIGDLPDVDLSTPPTDGQVLKYDNSSSKWKPAADAT